jgi:hypothetical protein
VEILVVTGQEGGHAMNGIKAPVGRIVLAFAAVFLTAATMSKAQDAGAMTDREKQIEARLRPVLNFALDTLSRKHTLGEAVFYLGAFGRTNKNLVADLTALSKTDQEGMRNLSLWCLEAAYPDDKAVWKAILRNGRIVDQSDVKEWAEHLSGFIKMGVLDWNSLADAHSFDVETRPAMKVAEFTKLYGAPDRETTLEAVWQPATSAGNKGGKKSYKWIFYGPIGVKVDDAQAVSRGQISMPFFLWIAAMKSYNVEFSSPSDFTGMHAETKERIPDMRQVFLRIGSKPR